MSEETSGDMPDFRDEPNLSDVLPELPPDCKDCALQCELRSRLTQLFVDKQITGFYLDNLSGESGDAFDENIDAQVYDEEVAAKFKRGARQAALVNVDAVDQEITATRGEAIASAAECSGVLEVTGVRDGIEYTASICTSERLYSLALNGGPPVHGPIHIRAKRTEDHTD